MKRVCTLLLCGILLLSFASAAQWPAWADEAREWGLEQKIDEELLAQGDAIVSRAQAAQLLYQAEGSPAFDGKCPFTDVSGPAAKAVAWAAERGYVSGVGGGRYEPDRPVTRQAFAAILWRWAGKPAAVQAGLEPYQDASSVSEWAREAMLWCMQAGIVRGLSGEKLGPVYGISFAQALTMLQRAYAVPDVSALRQDLQTLTKEPRPIGSAGEAAAAQYLKARFTEMGYTVTLQPYQDAQGHRGSNVIAVKKADKPNGDILILSAHHDSVPTAPGANDNASGAAALLYAAEALQDVSGDTEIRFVSFTDEENGKNGSRAYVASLSEQERERIVGDIQLDMLGGLGTDGAMVCTTDGEANWLSELLMKLDPSLIRRAETASDHASMQLAGIPSVMLSQDERGYLYHSAADTAAALDLYAIADGAETVAAAAKEILSLDTPSYRDVAAEQGGGYVYRQTRQNVIYFGASRTDTEAYIGAAGELMDTREISGSGWTDRYETYRYAMTWFDAGKPMETYYIYRNGFLDHIELRPEKSGYSRQEVQKLLEAKYGKPEAQDGERMGWADPIYSKYLSLSTDDQGCLVSISNYSVGITNVLASYPVKNGQASISDPEDQAVWAYVCSILPLEARQKITQFNLFTDGYSNVLAYTSPIQENGVTDNTRFSISIDYYDVYDEEGRPRDWSKLSYTIIHEYGHVLLEDEKQVDLSVGSNTHDPTGFVEGSFRKAFYDRFWKELGDSAVGDYEQNPTHYVSRYGANYFHEDIADTFAVFVLGTKPQGDTVAEEKLAFFWNDPEMTALRTAIRQNLGLEWPEGTEQTQPEQSEPVKIASLEALEKTLREFIAAAEQPPVLDVSALAGQAELTITVKNLYYNILSEQPGYKYAYDLQAELGKDQTLRCTFSYMPYRTGQYPAGFAGEPVADLAGLVKTARENLSREEVSIRITNPELQVDDMNLALQQVGGGYVLCALNRDGTAITMTPQNDLSARDAQARLTELDALAGQVYESCVRPGMSQMEQATALYTYLTEQVDYDFRYYSDRANMPYDSTTAYGALHNKLAICGGYAQALQLLFEKAGIPCITVTGKLGREDHMWNLARIDGQWLYFDATNDRHNAAYGFHYCGVGADKLTQYSWDGDWSGQLARALFP